MFWQTRSHVQGVRQVAGVVPRQAQVRSLFQTRLRLDLRKGYLRKGYLLKFTKGSSSMVRPRRPGRGLDPRFVPCVARRAL